MIDIHKKKFLIIQTAFIGDVILATPLIEKLHFFYPDSEIDFLVRKGNESLLTNNPYLKNIHIWDKKTNKIKNLISLVKIFRRIKYDYIINLQRFASTGIITAFSGGKFKVGFNKNPFSLFFNRKIEHIIDINKNTVHETKRNLNLIEFITDTSYFRPKLYPSKSDYEAIKQYQDNDYICIAPTSVWFTKQFPLSKWIEFADKASKKYKIYLIGAKSDSEFCNEIIKQTNHNIINLCGELTFLQSAALFEKAKMNFVNDSAPLHLCSSVNANVTAIFCSTVPEFGFGPLSDNSKIIETNIALKCRPCGLHGYKECPEKHFDCAYSIDIQMLLDRI